MAWGAYGTVNGTHGPLITVEEAEYRRITADSIGEVRVGLADLTGEVRALKWFAALIAGTGLLTLIVTYLK